MDEALDQGEQVILFLNRRGTATFVLCRDCGYVSRCPRCDIPLTYHGPRAVRPSAHGGARLVCHHCNHREPQPDRCPQCESKRIRYFGLGTEKVEQTIHQRWPDVRTLRWDHDTARNHAAHATILHLFSTGLAHVLVGTQMVAKGLDLPLVTVVGVISADTALNLPDFRSSERTFQLLTQVAGRAGRGLLGGRVVLQTYHPDHYAVVAAAAHDYAGFASQELAFRREQGYPPYRRLAKLVYEDTSLSRARAEGIPQPKVYSHSLGLFLHEPGPLIGLPWEQERCEGRGEVRLAHGQCFTMGLSVSAPIPEWDGQEVRMSLEEDVSFTEAGCQPIGGRQTAFYLV